MIGILCLKRYCERLGESHREIDDFCDYLLSLAQAEDLAEWDMAGRHLAFDGLGSALPAAIAHIPNIGEIGCYLREITASQMYSAGNTQQSADFLKRATMLCQVVLFKEVHLTLFLQPSVLISQWASPVTPALYERWITEGLISEEDR